MYRNTLNEIVNVSQNASAMVNVDWLDIYIRGHMTFEVIYSNACEATRIWKEIYLYIIPRI